MKKTTKRKTSKLIAQERLRLQMERFERIREQLEANKRLREEMKAQESVVV